MMVTAAGLCLAHCLALLILLLSPFASSSSAPTKQKKKPNFVLILTDDLDQTLGGAASLTKTQHLLADHGGTLPNWFVQTPVCCPSRAELLTGRMFHNLKVSIPPSNGVVGGCMHVNVTSDINCDLYDRYYFARYFAELGYTVGVFGKHLNKNNPETLPRGVDRMLINDGGDYLNPSFTWMSAGVTPSQVQFNNCTDDDSAAMPCYTTSVVGNASIHWIQDHIHRSNDDASSNDHKKPFFAYVSVKAPHLQGAPGFPMAIPAPWYANASVGTRAPRTPNYNVSCADHHWLVRHQGPLTALQAEKVDELYVSRLRTLLSVDDLVEEMINKLEELGVLDDTYILFTSDNGYRLGQFRMPQGKFHPYENDIRVPFLIRGPGISPSSVRKDIIGTHVDIMPTLLGLSQWDMLGTNNDNNIPSTMDGANLAGDLLHVESDGTNPTTLTRSRRRTAVLIEYISLGDVVRYGHLEDTYNHTFRALRIIDELQPVGRRNMKYVEFTDCRYDWNFTKEPMELELFDLDSDPYELRNIISEVPRDYVGRLRDWARRLFGCVGPTCRRDVVLPEPLWTASK